MFYTPSVWSSGSSPTSSSGETALDTTSAVFVTVFALVVVIWLAWLLVDSSSR